MVVSSVTEFAQFMHSTLVSVSQARVPSGVRSFSAIAESYVHTWPVELAEPTYWFARVIGLDIVSPETRRQNILNELCASDVTRLILEYSIPGEVEDACREEMTRVSKNFDELSGSFLQMLKANSIFLKFVKKLDLHGIELFRLQHSWPQGLGSIKYDCYTHLQTIAKEFPNLKYLNLSACNLHLVDWSVEHPLIPAKDKKIFASVECLNLEHNGLRVFAEHNPLSGVYIEDLVAQLPNLKKIIIGRGNNFHARELQRALEKYPHVRFV